MNFTVTQLATADLVSIFLASDGIVESQWFLVSTSRWTTHNGRAATGWTPINVSDNYNTSYSNMLLEGLGAFLRANMDIWFILNHMLWNINRLTTKGQSLFLLTFKFFVIGFTYLGVISGGIAVDEEIPLVHHGGVLSDRNQWEDQISRRCVMAVVISARSRTILETAVCAWLWVDWGETICPL